MTNIHQGIGLPSLPDLIRAKVKIRGLTGPQKIGDLMDETMIMLYGYDRVLHAAVENELVVTGCAGKCPVYEVNGAWVRPSEPLINKLRSYHRISHGYCPPCIDKYFPEFKEEMARFS